MALESALWERCKTGIKTLRALGHRLDIQRLENSVGVGHPDVEGCIDGSQLWIELKSCARPARSDTMIRPKVRESQSIWHRGRTEAGGKIHWVLIQVGEDHGAILYLIPGCHYDKIVAPEADLEIMSAVPITATTADVLLRAVKGW